MLIEALGDHSDFILCQLRLLSDLLCELLHRCELDDFRLGRLDNFGQVSWGRSKVPNNGGHLLQVWSLPILLSLLLLIIHCGLITKFHFLKHTHTLMEFMIESDIYMLGSFIRSSCEGSSLL